MIMKTRYFKLVTVCLLAVSLFASCLGDLDTVYWYSFISGSAIHFLGTTFTST